MTMRKMIAAAFGLCVLAGQAWALGPAEASESGASAKDEAGASHQDGGKLDDAALAALVASVKADLVDTLLDPEAAKFRRVVVVASEVPSGISYSVCGEFIGKNAYGAYTGYKRFIGKNGEVAVREDDEPVAGITESLWETVCVESATRSVVWSEPDN
jgi:hypothetical protein